MPRELNFKIDEQRCIRCGACAADCPVRIITLESGLPSIVASKVENCIECQHCFAVCPTAALSILAQDPDQGLQLLGNRPTPEQMETLIKGRRSVRRYRDENLPDELIQRILDVAWQAPTGVNGRGVLLTVIDDKETLKRFREEAYSGLADLIAAGRLPEKRAKLAKFVSLWQEKGIDVLFRNAPHLVIASAPRASTTPLADCLITLSYFELFAQTLDVGTLWNGFIQWTVDELVPRLQGQLGIPPDHLVGYAMLFGRPQVRYFRVVDSGSATVHRVSL